MVSPVVKNGLLHQSKGVIRARRRGYDPGSPGKIQFGDNFGIWDRVTAGRTVTYRERREFTQALYPERRRKWSFEMKVCRKN